jgi:hypothetical protein
MEARASLWTLHPAVAGEKVTAHAQGKAVGLIRAEELGTIDLHYGHPGANFMIVVEAAHHIVQIHDSWVSLLMSHLIDLLQPLHFTVTEEWIVAQEEFWQGPYRR